MSKTFITKDLGFGLQVSIITVYRWIAEGLPTTRQDPYHFDQKSIDWILTNKPKYKQAIEKMMEG